MVFLRSGRTTQDGPQQKYQSAEDVYRKETRIEFREKCPNLASIRDAQKLGWKALSEKQKERYAKQYEESVEEYEHNLIIYYGGNENDIEDAQEINGIPPKPKRPLTSFMIYFQEKRADFMKSHQISELIQATEMLGQRFNELSIKEKEPYVYLSWKQQQEYEEKMSKWEREYGKQFKEGQKTLQEQHKYHSKGNKQVLSQEEILSGKKRQELVPLGNQQNIINFGLDPFVALEDSFKSSSFQQVMRLLSTAREEQIRDKKNHLGQNLFHLFAQYAQSADQDIQEQIFLQLERKLIPQNIQDNFKRTPLHYAAKIGFTDFIQYLLEKKVSSPNDYDVEQNTPYSYALQRDYSSVLSKLQFPKWQAAGVNIKSTFRVAEKNYLLDTFMYLVQEKQVKDELLLDALLSIGSDINALNQDDETALFLSIRSNNETLFKFFLQKSKVVRRAQTRNRYSQTIFHVVVSSFENTFMLEELVQAVLFGSINQPDNQGRTPLDYALRQKSGQMAAILIANGGKANSQKDALDNQRL